MPSKKKRSPQIKRLFVIGAGASYNATQRSNPSPQTACLDKDFTRKLNDINFKHPKWVCPTRDKIIRNWDDEKEFNECGLEEAILRQVSHMDFNSTIHARAKPWKYKRENYLTDIAHVIAFMLYKTKEKQNTALYRKFSEGVFKAEFTALDARIISFNYDTLLDRHLLSRYKKQEVYFDAILENAADQSRKRKLKCEDPIMLKLHGSLNWWMPSAEFKKILSNHKGRLDGVFYSDQTIQAPDGSYAPCIIPPTPSKPITQLFLFKYLWKKAYDYLNQCSNLVIIGYSLPVTDTVALSLFSQFKRGNLTKVVIVDPDPSIIKKWKEIIGKRHSLAWQYFDSFEEYVSILHNKKEENAI